MYTTLFNEAAAQLAEYRRCLEAGDETGAIASAVATTRLFSSLEPSGRNAKIAITDGLSEFQSKIGDRIQFVQLAEKISKTEYGKRTFFLGTDPIGRDVLAQMLWACRLSISIGLVSTGISVLLGIVIGALMGYFGGWVDLVLSRVVEIFMAVPVLFLLIVAASALPRNTYVMMTIIGCVTWTGSARFIRAEFLKLRNQDFVQSCRAVGLPSALRAVPAHASQRSHSGPCSSLFRCCRGNHCRSDLELSRSRSLRSAFVGQAVVTDHG